MKTLPLPQAGEGVQGAALVRPRTPAERLACLVIKIQISGGCLNGATKERSEFRRTASQTRSLLPFCRAQKGSRLSGRDPTPSLNSDTPPRQEAERPLSQPLPRGARRGFKGPHPCLPPAGEGEKSPSPQPSPASGRGSTYQIHSYQRLLYLR